MTKKIFGTMKQGEIVIIFDESYPKFSEFQDLFSFNITKYLSFADNLYANLKEDEIFSLQLTVEEGGAFQEVIKCSISSMDLNNITKVNYKDVSTIYLVDSEKDLTIIKKIFPYQLVNARSYLGIGDTGPEYNIENNSITIRSTIDVVFNKNENVVHFRNFNTLKSIYPEIIKYYKEASEEEITSYFTNDCFELNIDLVTKSTSKMKRRIGILIRSQIIDFTDVALMKKYEKYDAKFRKKIKKENNKYVLKTKPQFENFIKLLEQTLYQTEITKEKREVDNYRCMEIPPT